MERKKEPQQPSVPEKEAEGGKKEYKKAARYQPWNLHNWMTFLMERAPPLVFLLLAAGPCLSGLYSPQTGLPLEKFVWALLGEQILLLTIRIMDDVKDYDKDVIVHPDRPLPRGLIKVEEVITFIRIVLVSMVAYGVLMAIRFGYIVGVSYLMQVSYGFLMYIEFGIGEWLDERPFLYALTHQVSIYFGALFISLLAGGQWSVKTGFLLGSIAFCGFFVYDICRKLDPHLPKLKGTYLVVYGKWPVFLVVSLLVLMGMLSAYMLNLHGLLWPLQLLMVGSLLVLFLKPTGDKRSKAHKPVEGFAVVFVLAHLWMAFIANLLSR